MKNNLPIVLTIVDLEAMLKEAVRQGDLLNCEQRSVCVLVTNSDAGLGWKVTTLENQG